MPQRFSARNVVFAGIVLIFVAAAIFFYSRIDLAQAYLNKLSLHPYLGFGAYSLLTFLGIIFAPLSSAFLTPVAVELWGWLPTFWVTIFVWQIGSMADFLLARFLGNRFVRHFYQHPKINSLQSLHEARQGMLFLLLAYFFLPIDFFSYTLGLARVSFWRHFWLMWLVGITPWVFLLTFGIDRLGIILTALIFFVISVIAVIISRKIQSGELQKEISSL